MQNVVRHTIDVVQQTNGGIKHVVKNAVVVLNESGKVITTFPLNRFGWRYWISLW